MRISESFILRSIADEHLLIPTGKAAMHVKGLIALSESGALLLQRIRDGAQRPELVEALLAEYDVNRSQAEADVDAFLDQMRQLEILVEE